MSVQRLEQRIGERIVLLREARGWNQRQLAEAAGVNKGQLSRLESGQRLPLPHVFLKLAKALDVAVSTLLPSDRIIWNAADVGSAEQMDAIFRVAVTCKGGLQFHRPCGRFPTQGHANTYVERMTTLAETAKVWRDKNAADVQANAKSVYFQLWRETEFANFTAPQGVAAEILRDIATATNVGYLILHDNSFDELVRPLAEDVHRVHWEQLCVYTPDCILVKHDDFTFDYAWDREKARAAVEGVTKVLRAFLLYEKLASDDLFVPSCSPIQAINAKTTTVARRLLRS